MSKRRGRVEMKREKMRSKKVFAGFSVFLMALAILFTGAVNNADASGITVYKDGDKFIKIGGRIQLQYHFQNMQTATTDPAGTDDIFFRRLRPFIEGSVTKNWFGKFQWDMGEAKKVALKDALVGYHGPYDIKVEFGNAYFRFSQEDLTSSKKQELVERTFVGDHHYGSPERNVGVHATGSLLNKKVTYGASVAIADITPKSTQLDFGTPVNISHKSGKFNQGVMAGVRASFHPFGYLPMSQGDLAKGPLKAVVNVAAFGWQNDDDHNNNTNGPGVLNAGKDKSGGKTLDVDNVEGLEFSGAVRFKGISVDAEYNRFRAETVDNRATGGIYKDGATTLENLAIEGGYMILANKLEAVVGFQRQDANNYAKKWKRTSFGLNYFISGNHVKGQVTYRIGENVDGVDGNDNNEIFVQTQYVF